MRKQAILTLFCFSVIRALTAACPCPAGPVKMWFVDNSNTVAGTGTYANPFNSLKLAEAASNPCDVIYVFPGNTPTDMTGMNEGIILKPNQRLLGTTSQAFQICPAASGCAAPVISNQIAEPISPVVLLSDNNEVSGFIIEDRQGAHCIANGLIDLSTFMGGIPITDAKITQNFIRPGPNAGGVVIATSPNLGNVLISNCTVNSLDPMAILGIGFASNGNAVVSIAKNTVTCNASNGLLLGIIARDAFGGPVDVSCTQNTLVMQDTCIVGIGAGSGQLMYDSPMTADIASNNVALINPPGGGAPFVAGILGTAFQTGTLCLSLTNNVSQVPYIPALGAASGGYILYNQNPATYAFILSSNNNNEGIFATPQITGGPFFGPVYPIQLWTECVLTPPVGS